MKMNFNSLQLVGDMASCDKLITKTKKMNKYLRKWIDETYPLMGDDIEELDHFDLQKFADWMEKQCTIHGVSVSLRDHLAGQAINGILGNSDLLAKMKGETEDNDLTAAITAYRIADCMIKVSNER